jgi:3-oxoacyl-[acyl-carrier protein] reductase
MPTTQRVAIVTGSSRGIGAAIALGLLSSGYKTALNYSTNKGQAAATLARCQDIDPDTILVKANVGNAAEASALINQTIQTFGRIDVLVNNAALVIDGPALDMTEDAWDRVMNVNLKGAFLCSQHAARQMMQQDSGGVILNIGASTGIRGRRNGVNTCASKAALMMMTQCLALELAPKIRVNTVIPGLVITEETQRRFGLDDPTARSIRTEQVPLQRLGQPDDVADAVMLMLADESRFITGQKLVVDGGQNMW